MFDKILRSLFGNSSHRKYHSSSSRYKRSHQNYGHNYYKGGHHRKKSHSFFSSRSFFS